MKKLIVLSAFALACGSSSSSHGGGALTGTIGGRPFAPAEVRAIRAGTGATPCSLTVPIPGGGGATTTIDFGVAGLALDIGSYANACDDWTSASCVLHASAQRVLVVFARLNGAGTEPAISPGTYAVSNDLTSPVSDGTGQLTVAYADSLATGPSPTCVPTQSIVNATGSTIRIDSVSSTTVTGHLALAFQDGGALAGDFSAPVCTGTTLDVCQLAQTQQICDATTPVCKP